MQTGKIYRELYFKKLSERFCNELNAGDIERELLIEVFNACALGCSLQKPRMFGKTLVSASDFRTIADAAPFESFAVAADALLSGKNVHNRLWYVLGVLVQNRPINIRTSKKRDNGFDERVYTPEQLSYAITQIDTLSESDL